MSPDWILDEITMRSFPTVSAMVPELSNTVVTVCPKETSRSRTRRSFARVGSISADAVHIIENLSGADGNECGYTAEGQEDEGRRENEAGGTS
jgi:hypothetical protein